MSIIEPETTEIDPTVIALNVPLNHIVAGPVEKVATDAIGLTPETYERAKSVISPLGIIAKDALEWLEAMKRLSPDHDKRNWTRAAIAIDNALLHAYDVLRIDTETLLGLPRNGGYAKTFYQECKVFAQLQGSSSVNDFIRNYNDAWRTSPNENVERWLKFGKDAEGNRITSAYLFGHENFSASLAEKLKDPEIKEKLATTVEKLEQFDVAVEAIKKELGAVNVTVPRFRGF